MYKLTKKSYDNLVGVHQGLVDCVTTAIQLTSIEFQVTEGLRTVTRQKQLVAKGASRTMNSRHLTGNAVDLVALIGGRLSWETELYYPIAEAMKAAAEHHNVIVTWGAAWNVPDITNWDGTMRSAVKNYINVRRAANKEVFLDYPHFEVNESINKPVYTKKIPMPSDLESLNLFTSN